MLKKLAILASAAAAIMSTAAGASTNLVTNGSFESTTLNGKGSFLDNVTGWSGGTGFTSLDTPGTATISAGPGNNYAVYGPFANTSPDGGNFVQMDGDSRYATVIYQQVTGLTVGQVYTLNFYQAAGQQLNYHGNTTEQWAVYFAPSATGAVPQYSSKYSLPSGGVGAWQLQTMSLTATATSEYLAFMAVGTPNGVPPTSFLDGVSLVAVPEPATWGMMIVGLGAMGAAARLRRGRALAIG